MSDRHPALVIADAMEAVGAETLGDLMDYCREHGTTPRELAAPTPVASPEGVVATGDHSGDAGLQPSLAPASPAPAPPVPSG